MLMKHGVRTQFSQYSNFTKGFQRRAKPLDSDFDIFLPSHFMLITEISSVLCPLLCFLKEFIFLIFQFKFHSNILWDVAKSITILNWKEPVLTFAKPRLIIWRHVNVWAIHGGKHSSWEQKQSWWTKTGKDGMMERKIKGEQTLIRYNLLA